MELLAGTQGATRQEAAERFGVSVMLRGRPVCRPSLPATSFCAPPRYPRVRQAENPKHRPQRRIDAAMASTCQVSESSGAASVSFSAVSIDGANWLPSTRMTAAVLPAPAIRLRRRPGSFNAVAMTPATSAPLPFDGALVHSATGPPSGGPTMNLSLCARISG